MNTPVELEIPVVADEAMGETDPLLARLLAAAVAGVAVPDDRRCPP